jgi:hypothetical protein
MNDESSDYLFLDDQGKPFNRATIWLVIRDAAAAAGTEDIQAYPHYVRHSEDDQREAEEAEKKFQETDELIRAAKARGMSEEKILADLSRRYGRIFSLIAMDLPLCGPVAT